MTFLSGKWILLAGIFVLGIIVGSLVFPRDNNKKAAEKILPAATQGESEVGDLTAGGEQNTLSTSSSVAEVSKVIDGDTIVLESGEIVRLIGIDAPEKNDCFSSQSTAENQRLVLGKQVRLAKDVSETDRYQRLLRFVWADEVFVNDYLVRQGFAKAYRYPPDVKYQEQFAQAEQEAKENNRGLWAECKETAGSINDKPGLPTFSKPGLDSSEDKDCKDFKTHAEAQAFFEAAGPGDPHRLDSDGDGIACESLP